MLQNLDIQPCVDPVFLKASHLQTIIGYLAPHPKAPKNYERWQINLGDGDALIGRFYPGKSKTVILACHGLAGCADSSYMHRTALIALELGHSILLLNHRGAGDGVPFAKKFYSSNSAEDVSVAIREIRLRKPGHAILGIGFSLSANILLNLLGGQSGSDQPDAAITVNPPVDLLTTSKEFRRGLNNIYDLHFVKLIKSELRGRREIGYHVPSLPKICRLEDIDEIFTAPSAGFESRLEYYDKCSSMHVIHKIAKPTLILMAENDPFIPVRSFHQLKFPDCVRVHIEKTGGHMGYLTSKKTPLGNRRWLDYFLHEAMKTMCERTLH